MRGDDGADGENGGRGEGGAPGAPGIDVSRYSESSKQSDENLFLNMYHTHHKTQFKYKCCTSLYSFSQSSFIHYN